MNEGKKEVERERKKEREMEREEIRERVILIVQIIKHLKKFYHMDFTICLYTKRA